jgi:flagella basal body P-ring formation protein FlgA
MLSIALLGLLARATPRVLAWLLAGALVFVLVVLGLATPAAAEEAAPPLDPSLIDGVRSLALANTAAAGGHRVEVVIGQLDPRLHLAPCRRVEPYLPLGVRLWGKARIGLRCKEGPTPWNVYLPVTVKVFGRAVTVPGGAAAGSIVSAADLGEAEVDLAEEFSPAIVDPKAAEGRVLAQAVRPGQALRESQLKARQYFAAGETVKIVASGAGFALEAEGQALNPGIEGQPARVRTESGRVLTGIASGERRVEVPL